MLTYKVEYKLPGRGPVTGFYRCEEPLQVGQWVEVNGMYLVIERLVRGKPGDREAGILFCRPAAG